MLADATKLQCRLVRGQGLCASDSGAVAVVMIGSAEFVVDLVHTPGRLYGLEQYAAITKLKRSRKEGRDPQIIRLSQCARVGRLPTLRAMA